MSTDRPPPSGPPARGPGAASAIADALERDGYVVVPLLGPAEVGRLRAGYAALAEEPGFGCRPSTTSPDPAFRTAARDLVRSVLEPPVRSRFPDLRCVVAAFVPKEPGPGSEMPLHQDWSTCDERRWQPMEVWVPLTPIGPHDGPLEVVAGSHRFAAPRRGSGMELVVLEPPGAASADGRGEPADVDLGRRVALDVAVGDAVCFHPALAHGSAANRGSDLRLAVISTFQPADAPLVHHRRRPDGSVATYQVDGDFYLADPDDVDRLGRLVAPDGC